MTRTFAMDVNESFGGLGHRKQFKEDGSLELGEETWKRHKMQESNDPKDILKSLREGVQRAIHESKLRGQNIKQQINEFEKRRSSSREKTAFPYLSNSPNKNQNKLFKEGSRKEDSKNEESIVMDSKSYL